MAVADTFNVSTAAEFQAALNEAAVNGQDDTIILAAGSELHVAVEAAKEIGAGCRVVSMPCMELFEEQDAAYKAEVLPNKAITTAFEAGATGLWYKYADKVLGVDSFGLSAPGDQVFEEKGVTTEGILKAMA